MPAFNLDNDALPIKQHLQTHRSTLVAFLCAFWCSSCREFMAHFEQLAQQFPHFCFVWIDIENHPELVEAYDVTQFPSLLIETADQVHFLGPVVPQSGIIERMLSNLPHLTATSQHFKLWKRLQK